MINNTTKIQNEKTDDKVIVKSSDDCKIIIDVNKKTINTKEIYNFLKYEKNKKYKLDCRKIKENDIQGNEINRLYNYVYDLFDSIITAIKEIS